MALLRERQIKEILDADNFFKRIVIERQKEAVKNYQDNIKEPQVIDKTIADDNKKSINTFLDFLNSLYVRLSFLNNNENEKFRVLGNRTSGEGRQFLESINITKPFRIWENLMNEYISPELNQVTRETITINLQKLTPFLIAIKKYLRKISLLLTGTFAYKMDVVDIYEYFMFVFGRDLDILSGEDKLKVEKLEKIDTYFLKPVIEAYAFYDFISKSIQKSKYKPPTKQDIAYHISDIIVSLFKAHRYARKNEVLQELLESFKDEQLPELAPYFRKGFDTFKSVYDELEAMAGLRRGVLVPPPPAVPFVFPLPPDDEIPPLIPDEEEPPVAPEPPVEPEPPVVPPPPARPRGRPRRVPVEEEVPVLPPPPARPRGRPPRPPVPLPPVPRGIPPRPPGVPPAVPARDLVAEMFPEPEDEIIPFDFDPAGLEGEGRNKFRKQKKKATRQRKVKPNLNVLDYDDNKNNMYSDLSFF